MAEESKGYRDRFGRLLRGRGQPAEDEAVDTEGGGDEAADTEGAGDEPAHSHEGWQTVDISDTPAPSIGPHTTFELPPPEERLAGREQSDVDAMGLDKRRAVVGGQYSPPLARQATVYGIVIAVLAALVIGFVVLANKLDQPPDEYADEAPWSQQEAAQRPPAPIDFPNYGKPGGEDAPGPEL
jgi:hypothetical protein